MVWVSTTDENCSVCFIIEGFHAVNCLLSGVNILAGGQPLHPEILAPSDLLPPEGGEF